jgi:hypothetical protein
MISEAEAVVLTSYISKVVAIELAEIKSNQNEKYVKLLVLQEAVYQNIVKK